MVVATERNSAIVIDDFTPLVSPETYEPKLKPVKARNPHGIEARSVFLRLKPVKPELCEACTTEA